MLRHAEVLLCLLGAVAGSLWLAGSPPTSAAEDPPKKNSLNQKFMRVKLGDAKDVLQGLATEDFKMIEKGADHLRMMSQATEWNVIAGPEYLQHSAEFRRCCDELIKRARKRNIDACALAHLQLTMSCINCHQFVRSTRK